MPTPLKPEISLEQPGRFGAGVCNTCGTASPSVRALRFGWMEREGKVRQGAGTIVALCGQCRQLTAAALRGA